LRSWQSLLRCVKQNQPIMSTYKIDAAHSEITFKVKHLMITNVTGSFTKFDATMEASSEGFSDAKITFEADVNSITTNNEQRDGHLKGDDFFAAEKFPTLSFVSTAFAKTGADEYTLTGDLTLRGVTKPVQLAVEYGGTATDPYGQVKAGFEINGKINRKDFGLSWGAVTEAGGIVVSDEVKLQLAVQMIKQ
jgi:polyisoprenoid-binding protein YceI